MSDSNKSVIRRFHIHILPSGFHRIRHYGLLANKARSDSLTLARKHLQVLPKPQVLDDPHSPSPVFVCRECGKPMIIIGVMERNNLARAPPILALRHEPPSHFYHIL